MPLSQRVGARQLAQQAHAEFEQPSTQIDGVVDNVTKDLGSELEGAVKQTPKKEEEDVTA